MLPVEAASIIKHSPAHLQDLIPTLVGVISPSYIFYTSQSRDKIFVDVLENALFVHAFGYMFELTVTGWCIIAT